MPSRPEPLQHPRRQLIFGYIQAHPGATFREVARGTAVATGTARHHLGVLKRRGLVMERPHRSTTRFFENHGLYDATWSCVVLLREAPLRELHSWLAANAGAPQKDVLEAMAGQGWSRSTTQHRLQRLVEGGAVEVRLQGRLKIYWAGGGGLPAGSN
jgi:predicted transcriptional regulator